MKDKIVLSGVNDLKNMGITRFFDGKTFIDIQITTLFMELEHIEEIIKIIQKYDDFKITIEPIGD